MKKEDKMITLYLRWSNCDRAYYGTLSDDDAHWFTSCLKNLYKQMEQANETVTEYIRYYACPVDRHRCPQMDCQTCWTVNIREMEEPHIDTRR